MASLAAGCGKSSGSDSGSDGASNGGEGKVINIYSWNDEFRKRVEKVYPEVKKTSKDGTVTVLNDGTEIHWIINPNQDGVYQQKLDEALMQQADASADDKVDIFLSETDYVNKYTDAAADAAIPLKDLGIDPDKDLADQYDFTKVTASDADGVQRGSTWQCCPGLLVYRRDIAKEVFGTDNPEHVKDIILAVTADKNNLLKISKKYSDFTNTTSGMKKAAKDDSIASEFLGGQNAFKYFVPVAEKIEIAPLSAYDQGCVELIQNSFSDYLQGKVDYDKAKKNFETAIIERYPDITEIQWPE